MRNKDRYQLIQVLVPTNTAIAVALAFGGGVPPALATARDNKTGRREYFTQDMVRKDAKEVA